MSNNSVSYDEIYRNDKEEFNKNDAVDVPDSVETSKNEKLATASLAELFSMADSLDILLMLLGSLGGMASGGSLPLFCIFFGQMLDSLNTGGDVTSAVNKICIDFVIIGCLNIVAGSAQVTFWTIAGERQSQRFKEKYVRSILSQEVKFLISYRLTNCLLAGGLV